MTARLLVGALLLAAAPLHAQGVLRGTITDSATRAPVVGAEVSVLETGRVATSDSTGAYAIVLPEGIVVVQVRKFGYQIARIGTRVTPAGNTFDFTLAATRMLDTVKTVALRMPYRSAGLRGFEQRRVTNESGRFISEEELRQADEKSVASVVAQRVPGVLLVPVRWGGSALASSRKSCTGPILGGGKAGSCTPCYVSVYIDGQLVFPKKSDQVDAFDFNQIAVKDLAGIEFYAGTGVGPAGFNITSDGCGSLFLWTREK